MAGAFRESPQTGLLPDGRRFGLRHGPIELVIEANGVMDEVAAAYHQASKCFGDILPELVGELDLLRSPVTGNSISPEGTIAWKMHTATRPHAAEHFVTPMVAVAGAVADHVLEAMVKGRDLERAYVNNGGDIALHLAKGASFEIGVCANPENGSIASRVSIQAEDCVRGVATSGWRGRSQSLGIADAVTVLAATAAEADVAATLIANAVNLSDHPAVSRLPAIELVPDSDLGECLVTVGVDRLSVKDVALALRNGRNEAIKMADEGLIIAAYGSLQSQSFQIDATGRGGSVGIPEAVLQKHLEANYA